MNILALDLGTSSVRAAVLELESGKALGPIARTACPLERPTPEAATLSAERLWQAVSAAAREAVQRSHVAGTPGDVAGIGLSVMTPALVLLNKQDQPLVPIWTQLDRRARPVARQVSAVAGPEFLATTGNRPLPGAMSVLSYRQMLTPDPYLCQDVRSYLHLNGWLALRLTGEKAFDPANASFTGLFGTMTDRRWSPRWCEYFEVEPAWLPAVVSGATTIGQVRSAAATELGVPAGIPVKLGSADTTCAMLAAGAQAGDVLHSPGTTHVLTAFADPPRPDPRRLTRLFGLGERYVHVTCNPLGSDALEWLRQLCFSEQSAEDFYAKTLPAARQRQTRVTLDPPCLAGDGLQIEACRAAFRDLEATTDRLDLAAAVLEALARLHREALANLGLGDEPQRIFLSDADADVARGLIPAYETTDVRRIEDAPLFGIARLFARE